MRVNLIAVVVLLGKCLPRHYLILAHWWNIIRAATIWQIWKSRSCPCLDNKPSTPSIIRAKTWHHLKLYLREACKDFSKEVDRGEIMIAVARREMERHYGDDAAVFVIVG